VTSDLNIDREFEMMASNISDGSRVRYFTCADPHGLFVRAAQIESVINDLQPNLARSASNQSIKSQGSSTGSIPAPTSTGVPKASGVPGKQTGLKAPSSVKAPRKIMDGGGEY
jgi:hypothetical protein